MPGLTALLLATPIFGFSLSLAPMDATTFFAPDSAAEVVASLPVLDLAQAAHASAEDQAEADRRYSEQVRQRQELGSVHRALGIATWIAMTFTNVLGLIQYSNLYGFGAGVDQTPCSTGHAVPDQGACSGTPWLHLTSAIVTTALYTTTFTISLILPDPNEVNSGTNAFSDRLRIHEALRWVHLIGMIAQVGMGIGLANGWFGDRANNYDTLQIVAGVHQAIGWTTWAALTGAGIVMLID